MKYGLLINRKCLNLGDDIQSYAESLFLPKIDYLVDREYISDFKPAHEDERVATIMGAWWSFRKWNFPPPKNVHPLWVSMHVTDYTVADGGTPVYDEFLQGVGGDYMRSFSPIGTRDMATLDVMKRNDIPAFFSGCVTLTLPKQKIKKLEKEYILLVDLEPRVEKKIRADLEGADVEIKKVSNIRSSRRTDAEMDDWEFRKNEAIELLELFQNAKCVITSRLHAALPCLSMEVPVFCIFDPNNSRFAPYNTWLHMQSPSEFLKGNYEYDFLNPRPNKKTYVKYRNLLKERITEFVESTKQDSKALEDSKGITHTDKEILDWRHKLMEFTLDKWVVDSQVIAGKLVRLEYRNAELKDEHTSLTKKYDEMSKEYSEAKKELNRLKSQPYYKIRRKAGSALRKIGLRK